MKEIPREGARARKELVLEIHVYDALVEVQQVDRRSALASLVSSGPEVMVSGNGQWITFLRLAVTPEGLPRRESTVFYSYKA